MVVTYRNNRLAPVVIIAVCVVVFYSLIGPARQAPSPLDAPALREWAPQEYQHVSVEPVSGDEDLAANLVSGSLSASDVVLMVKTGGTSLWKRLPIHLATSLSPSRIPHANAVIYSDSAETLGAFTTVDVLSNHSGPALSSPEFDVYRDQAALASANWYPEASGLEGDDWGPAGGWVVDKYKFLPLMRHAGEAYPDAKWYIYLEDDAYIFLPNVLAYLSRHDDREAHYLGHYAAKSGVVFAHGGAGFAVSRGAWERSFGAKDSIVEDWHQYTADRCCGDQVLGAALLDSGVQFGENGDGKFTWGFNPVVHWAFAFSRWNWCEPLMSWHKVHSRDIARYYHLERSWDFAQNGPLLHRDFFRASILPTLRPRAEWWDNRASLYEVNSANGESAATPPDDFSAGAWSQAWKSADTCEAACESWAACVAWTWVEDSCKMDDKLTEGTGYAPGMPQRKTSLKHVSGWLTGRLDAWTC